MTARLACIQMEPVVGRPDAEPRTGASTGCRRRGARARTSPCCRNSRIPATSSKAAPRPCPVGDAARRALHAGHRPLRGRHRNDRRRGRGRAGGGDALQLRARDRARTATSEPTGRTTSGRPRTCSSPGATSGCRSGRRGLGRISVAICYDIWFPEVFRLRGARRGRSSLRADELGADARAARGLPVMANILAMAGAHANGLFVAAADRVGTERGQPFLGRSLIVGPQGWPLAGPASADRTEILFAEVDLAAARPRAEAERVQRHPRRPPRRRLRDGDAPARDGDAPAA